MDNYFDLHFHPMAKNHLAPKPKESHSKKANAATMPISMTKAFKDYTDENVLRRLESQCCIDYLNEAPVRYGIAAIAAIEFGMASSKGFLADVLKSYLKKPLDDAYFDAIKEGEVSYLNLFLKEVALYLKNRNLENREPHTKGSLNLIARPSKNTREAVSKALPNLVFAIEGGHNLCMKKIGNALDYDSFEGLEKDAFFDPTIAISEDNRKPQEVLKKLYKAFRDYGLDVLYLTLTHLTHIPEQHLATHAYGTKNLRHPSFYPFGNGLSELGEEVVRTAYKLEAPTKKKDDAGVLIDIKHLSLKSREDLYALREKEGFGKIPLIASHVGVTGYSISDWKHNLEIEKCANHVDQGIKTVKLYTQPKVAGYWGADANTEFSFHPGTINLMDEDIIEIANSNGLIGVGLDVDILGYSTKSKLQEDVCEFITTPDFIHYFPYTSIKSIDYASVEEIQAEESWLEPSKKEVHPLSFCFNIIHIMAVIGLKTKFQDAPEKFICIGSDFDAFIEPSNICSDSRQFKNLKACLMKWLPVAAKKYQKVNGGAKDLFDFTKKKKELNEVVVGILYENGREFLDRRGFLEGLSEPKKGETSTEAELV
ncbi:hypothetical protein ZORO111903_09815 [Zobellia roscoffensis]|uniref:hypothetical protein n=1 Tax=Zobellia roscoffensis TaxID=2779508 RepID=UPI00188B93ED|nr:hypothetical protein [Zobellia roscoffensis]